MEQDGQVEDVELAPGVWLQRLTAADGAEFADHIRRDLGRLSVFLPWPALTADTDGATQWLGKYERQVEGRVVAAGIREAGVLLGGTVLFHHDEHAAAVELGCWVVAGGEGRGLVRRACVEGLRHARHGLAVERVVWQCDPANARSRRLAERLGFRYEGTLRSSYVLREERRDTDVLSLVGPEIDAAVRG